MKPRQMPAGVTIIPLVLAKPLDFRNSIRVSSLRPFGQIGECADVVLDRRILRLLKVAVGVAQGLVDEFVVLNGKIPAYRLFESATASGMVLDKPVHVPVDGVLLARVVGSVMDMPSVKHCVGDFMLNAVRYRFAARAMPQGS